MNKLQKTKYLLITFISFLIFQFAQGSAIDKAKEDASGLANTVGYSTGNKDTLFIIGTMIGYALYFIGSIFLILTIINGFKWMTAGGNEEDVKKARLGIMSAIKGLAIIIIAYAITTLLQNVLSTIMNK